MTWSAAQPPRCGPQYPRSQSTRTQAQCPCTTSVASSIYPSGRRFGHSANGTPWSVNAVGNTRPFERSPALASEAQFANVASPGAFLFLRRSMMALTRRSTDHAHTRSRAPKDAPIRPASGVGLARRVNAWRSKAPASALRTMPASLPSPRAGPRCHSPAVPR